MSGADTLAKELEIAVRAARGAGAVALRHREGELIVETKAGDEPVTAADLEASRLIVRELRAQFPDDLVVSEEDASHADLPDARRVWFIDPIDGTKDYVAGLDGFSVMIGLVIDHQPTLGVVYQPVGDRLFSAAPGVGAWFFAPQAEPRRLQVSSVDSADHMRLVASKSSRDEVIDEVKSALGITDEDNIGSVGLKLALIALGERDLYVNPTTNCKAWDTAAPQAILEHAGGKLTDVHGDPLRYDRPGVRYKSGLVASNGALHDLVVAKLAPIFPKRS